MSRHFADRRKRRKGKGRSRREPENGLPWTGWGSSPTPRRHNAARDPRLPLRDLRLRRPHPRAQGDRHIRHLVASHRLIIGSRRLELRERRHEATATAAEVLRALWEAGEDSALGVAKLWGDHGGSDIAVVIDSGRMSIRIAMPGREVAKLSHHGTTPTVASQFPHHL